MSWGSDCMVPSRCVVFLHVRCVIAMVIDIKVWYVRTCYISIIVGRAICVWNMGVGCSAGVGCTCVCGCIYIAWVGWCLVIMDIRGIGFSRLSIGGRVLVGMYVRCDVV